MSLAVFYGSGLGAQFGEGLGNLTLQGSRGAYGLRSIWVSGLRTWDLHVQKDES